MIFSSVKNHATASSDVVFIGEGLPHPETMPFDEFTFTLKDGTKTTMRGSQLVAALTYQPTQGSVKVFSTIRFATFKYLFKNDFFFKFL